VECTGVKIRPDQVGNIAVLGASLVLVLDTWSAVQVDDAFISYRYARNLSEGLGLVYNPGEYVEGMTNLLWTLLIALGLELGVEAPQTAHILGVLAGVLSLVGSSAVARALLPEDRVSLAALAPWLLLASPGLTRWSESGLETSMSTALVTWAFWAGLGKRDRLAAVLLGLAFMTRPDAILAAAVLFTMRLWQTRHAPLRIAPAIGLLALIGFGTTLFRVIYFGEIVPNTFHAKVSDTDPALGIAHALLFLNNGMLLWLLAACGSAILVPAATFVPVYWLILLAYDLSIGGDVLGIDRLFLPVLPSVTAALVAASAVAWKRRPSLALPFVATVAMGAVWQIHGGLPVVALGLLVIAAGLVLWVSEHGLARLRWGVAALVACGLCVALAEAIQLWDLPGAVGSRASRLDVLRKADAFSLDRNRQRARRISELNPPVRLAAAIGIGVLGYESRTPVLDLVGLVDAEIARHVISRDPRYLALPGHQRSHPDYVMARRPDIIVIRKQGAVPILRAEADIWAHPEFDRLYAWNGSLRAYWLRERYLRPSPRAERSAPGD
jgi:hypothetical protein